MKMLMEISVENARVLAEHTHTASGTGQSEAEATGSVPLPWAPAHTLCSQARVGEGGGSLWVLIFSCMQMRRENNSAHLLSHASPPPHLFSISPFPLKSSMRVPSR